MFSRPMNSPSPIARGKSINKESDAEQDTHAECHECLSAEIAVHAGLDVRGETKRHPLILFRKKCDPSVGNLLVIEQDKKEVEDDNK